MANIGWWHKRNRGSQWFSRYNTASAWFNVKDFGPGTLCTVTGTITASTTEADIVAGGKTIILTLSGDTWIAAGAASFDLQRQNIINGLTSAQSETLGWNLVVKALQSITGVIRTSDTVVTITLDAQATYNITAQETITVTVPGTAVVLGNAIVASPTFTVAATGSTSRQCWLMMGMGR